MKHFRAKSLLIAAGVAAVAGISACNIFDPFDSPTSDPQLLSAARACFDQGKFDCAADLYAKVSPAQADAVNSELAFQILDQNGAGMGEFMTAFGNGSGGSDVAGKGFTSLAGHMSNSGGDAGETKRLAILSAFQKTQSISDPDTRAVVRFASAAAMIAEILAEQVTTPGVLVENDIVKNSTQCRSSSLPPTPTCLVQTGCNYPVPAKITIGSAINGNHLPTSGTTGMTGEATYYMINAAISELNTALGELTAAGNLGTTMQDFIKNLQNTFTASLVLADTVPASLNCARLSLILAGIGVAQ